MSHWRKREEECLTREAISHPSALPVLKAVVWRLHDLEVTCTSQSLTSFPGVKHSGKMHPEFTLQWCRTHRVLSSSSEQRCVYTCCLLNPHFVWDSLVVPCTLLGRGSSEKSKQLSSRLNFHYIVGLNSQGVFKCDCSRAFVVDFLFGFPKLLGNLFGFLFLPSWALFLICVWFIPSSYLYK